MKNLPTQAAPVQRTTSVAAADQGIMASGFPCTLCKLGCSALAPTPQALCLAACDATVC